MTQFFFICYVAAIVGSVFPAVVFDHVRKLDDELALLVFLRRFESVLLKQQDHKYMIIHNHASEATKKQQNIINAQKPLTKQSTNQYSQ